MPIPTLPVSGEMTREQVINMYAQEPYGWTKVLEFPWIEIDQRSGNVVKVLYRFDADANPCSDRNCVQYQLTFLRLAPSGVYKTCAICRRTEGPITKKLGILQDRVPISVAEAWIILGQTGQTPPKGLQAMQSSGTLRIIR